MAVAARTIRQGTLGKHKLRLVQRDGRFYGLVDGQKCVEGSDADDVWRRLHDDAGKTDPQYLGYDSARARFLKFFPNGFDSDGFRTQERDYKWAAKRKLDAAAPLAEALSGTGLGEAILSVYQTNLLAHFEQMRVRDVVRGPNSDAFVQAAAQFAIEGTEAALGKLERVLKPHDCAKWTVATYLPFLWRPEAHMFLKPEVTKDFAERVGHRLASEYQPQLKFEVYQSFLDLAEKTANELSELAPRDRIDVQSFIWVVGKYADGCDEVFP